MSPALNFSRAADSNIRILKERNNKNAVHLVLAHLCHELDEPVTTNDDGNNGEQDDAEIFEQMLVFNKGVDSQGGTDQELDNISILSVQFNFAPTTGEFWGACLDSGAQRTVISQKRADSYLRQTADYSSISQSPEVKSKIFKFRNNSNKCNGVLPVCMPFADDIVIKFNAFIFPIDDHFCLDLYVLCKLELIINFGDGPIQNVQNDWHLKLAHKLGLLYGERRPEVYYTETEL